MSRDFNTWGFTRLDKRRSARNDLIGTFKILSGKRETCLELFLTMEMGGDLRGQI